MLELAQLAVIVAALTLALGLLARPDVRRRRGLAAWVGLAAVGCFYTAGEEASWGQHLFGWRTPEEWRAINDQGETNLHNTSSWLDQKPRLLLELGVVAGGIVIPLLERVRPHLRRSPFAVIVPPMICLPSAVLAELSIGIERALGLAGIEFDEVLHFRPSELQELYFYLFVLFYLHALRQRLHPNRRASSVGS